MGFPDYTIPPSQLQGNALAVNLNLQKGQNNQFQTDKSDPQSLQLMRNMYHRGGNAVLRNGYELFTEVEGLQSIDIYKNSDGNSLVAAVDDTTNTKIIKIDRSTGAESDLITGLVGQGEIYTEDLRGGLFATNGGDTNVHYYDGTTSGTIAFNYGGGAVSPLFLASDSKRLWAVSDESPEQVLVFSNDRGSAAISTTGFNAGASTSIDRAGIASSKITKFTALKGVGESIIACGESMVEIFRVPDFATAGLTDFPADIPLSIKVLDNVGVQSKDAIVTVPGYAFIIGKDGVLHRISENGAIKSYRGMERTMDDLDFSQAAIGYDQKRNLIYISCERTSIYDTVIVFNILEENFAEFNNIYAAAWAFDGENIYFKRGDKIFDAFQEEDYTDNGLRIDWDILTQANWGGSLENYKKAVELFLHTLCWEDTKILCEFIADRGIDGGISAEKTINKENVFVLKPFAPNPQNIGAGEYGGASINFNVGSGMERVYSNDKINRTFGRYELRFSGSSSNAFQIKGLGIKYQMTSRKIKNLTFN
jgi:hypothetical protein